MMIVIRETLRRHLTSIAFGSYLALLTIVGLASAYASQPASMWPSLIALLSIIVGCGAIGPEFSSGTLQLILVKPLTRAHYLLARVAGVVGVVWLATLTAFFAEAVGRLIHGGVAWDVQGTALLNSGVDALLTVSLLTLFGSLTRAYLNVAIYIGIRVGLTVLAAILNIANRFPELLRGIVVVEQNLFPSLPRGLDPQWLLLVSANAAVALVIACCVFRAREVPYGAD
jgi:ABC-type transport system involved in multi-copper enzyme maturation permease subunit